VQSATILPLLAAAKRHRRDLGERLTAVRRLFCLVFFLRLPPRLFAPSKDYSNPISRITQNNCALSPVAGGAAIKQRSQLAETARTSLIKRLATLAKFRSRTRGWQNIASAALIECSLHD
jgi:hypothetical protein